MFHVTSPFPVFGKRFAVFLIAVMLLACSTLIVPSPVYAESDPFPIAQNLSAAITETDNDQLLQAQNGSKTYAPLRMVCFLIALTALENADLADVITVPSDVLSAVPDHLDVIYLEPGEQLTVRQLIGAVLYNVANDAAYALAVGVGGSVEDFLEMMNETARRHRAEHSNFTSIFSDDVPGQYTTAVDLSYIAAGLWKNDSMVLLLNGDIFTIPATNKTETERYYANPCTMRLLGESDYYYCAVFSRSCDECMVIFSQNDELSLVSVIFGETKESQTYADGRSMMVFGHEYFQKVQVEFPGNSVARLPVYRQNARIGYADVILKGNVVYYGEIFSRKPTDAEGLENFFTHTMSIPEYLNEPVTEGQKVGSVTYTMISDPAIQVTLDLTIGSLILSDGTDVNNPTTVTAGISGYLTIFSILLLIIALILTIRLVWPWLEKKIHKPKKY